MTEIEKQFTPAQMLYPDCYEGGKRYDGPSDYRPLLQSLGVIVLQVDDDGYQGDSRLILKRGDGACGLLIFGWGSCSGCDALQACESWQDIEELRQKVWGEIHWEDTKEALVKYITAKDWEAEYSWHDESTRLFVRIALAILGFESKLDGVSGYFSA